MRGPNSVVLAANAASASTSNVITPSACGLAEAAVLEDAEACEAGQHGGPDVDPAECRTGQDFLVARQGDDARGER